ncbi:MAG: tetratricopeptide repeat protein [Candidatus Faecivicinus sp.]
MGLFDSMKSNQMGTKAYRTHVAAMQLRKNGKYAESEAKLDEAIKLYDEAYAMGFRKSNVLQGYALLLMRRGKFERAREIMLECSKDKQMSADDRFSLRVDFSICQWKMGRLDKAIETMRTAAQSKMNGMVYTTLGMYLVEQARQTGDFEEVMKLNEEAYEYDDEDAGVLDNMGQMYLAMSEKSLGEGNAELADEQRAKALGYLKKACEIKPDQISSAYFYAKALHESGDNDQARKILKKAMEIPFSAILQISREDAEMLLKEIG